MVTIHLFCIGSQAPPFPLAHGTTALNYDNPRLDFFTKRQRQAIRKVTRITFSLATFSSTSTEPNTMSRKSQIFPASSGMYFLCFLKLLVLALLCVVPAGTSVAADKPEAATPKSSTTFIVVRHAERDGNQDSLSLPGTERANLLGELGKFLNVSAIYSTNTQRTKNTVKPLAEALALEVNLYGTSDQAWVDKLRQQHAADVVLIVGHSNTTGVIAGLLAAEPPFSINHDEYNTMFIVTTTEARTSCVRLKYGPSSHGAPAADADKMGADKSR